MKTKTTMLKASVLFITAAIIISLPAGMAKTTTTPTASAIQTCSAVSNTQQTFFDDVIVWDNGAPTGSLYSSQLDTAYPFVSHVADDFIFAAEQEITAVHAYWGFWNGDPLNPCDINVYIFADDGTGNAPEGAGMPDPSSVALQTYTFIDVDGGGPDQYESILALDPPFVAEEGTKYWLSIQGKLDFPPQFGWSATIDKMTGAIAVQGFPLLGTVYWTAISPATDMAFKLYGPETAAPELAIESIAGGFGVSAAIKNIGDADATNVTYTITLDGGLIILGKETTNSIPTIAAGASEAIKAGFILGIGKTTITISASCDEGATASATATGTVLLFFVLGVA